MTLVADGEDYIEPTRVWTGAINGLLSGSFNTTRVNKAIDQAFDTVALSENKLSGNFKKYYKMKKIIFLTIFCSFLLTYKKFRSAGELYVCSICCEFWHRRYVRLYFKSQLAWSSDGIQGRSQKSISWLVLMSAGMFSTKRKITTPIPRVPNHSQESSSAIRM